MMDDFGLASLFSALLIATRWGSVVGVQVMCVLGHQQVGIPCVGSSLSG